MSACELTPLEKIADSTTPELSRIFKVLPPAISTMVTSSIRYSEISAKIIPPSAVSVKPLSTVDLT